ncbi:hypothetical protein [Nocardia rhamnosiphila]|uniref:AB hydrolase-1 domain-containing protein n=1 Tax=Nocardia rhamnosiphila TaxID=426716 RepID=A0ABV2WXM7_9NOCA
MGGAVAMQLAAQAPGRVRPLVLGAPAGFGREVALSLRLLTIPPLCRLATRTWSPRTARRLEKSLFYDAAMVTPERVQFGYRLARRPEGTRVLLETLTALGGPRGAHVGWRTTLLDVMADRAVTYRLWSAAGSRPAAGGTPVLDWCAQTISQLGEVHGTSGYRYLERLANIGRWRRAVRAGRRRLRRRRCARAGLRLCGL